MLSAEYTKAFIVGSSWPVFITFFNAVSRFVDTNTINIDYVKYSKLAPFLLGLLNVCGLWISRKFHLSCGARFVLTGIIGATVVSLFITKNKIYNYNTKAQWREHYVNLYVLYFITFVVVIGGIESIL